MERGKLSIKYRKVFREINSPKKELIDLMGYMSSVFIRCSENPSLSNHRLMDKWGIGIEERLQLGIKFK